MKQKIRKPGSPLEWTALAAVLGLALVFFLECPVQAVLENLGLTYRPRVTEGLYLLACLFIVVLALCAIILLFRLTNREWKRQGVTLLLRAVGWLGGTALVLALPMVLYVALLGYAFLYTPEHEVLLDGEPVVACVHSFLEVQVYAHADRGPLLMSADYESFDYGNGGYDPFEQCEDGLPEPFEARK